MECDNHSAAWHFYFKISVFEVKFSFFSVRPKSESFIDISDDEFDDNVKPSSNIKFRTPQPTKPREKSKPSVTKTKINTDSKPSTVVSSFKSLTSSSASSGSQHLTHSFLRSLAKDISDSSRHPDAVR